MPSARVAFRSFFRSIASLSMKAFNSIRTPCCRTGSGSVPTTTSHRRADPLYRADRARRRPKEHRRSARLEVNERQIGIETEGDLRGGFVARSAYETVLADDLRVAEQTLERVTREDRARAAGCE